jgi:hypothetical protein
MILMTSRHTTPLGLSLTIARKKRAPNCLLIIINHASEGYRFVCHETLGVKRCTKVPAALLHPGSEDGPSLVVKRKNEVVARCTGM